MNIRNVTEKDLIRALSTPCATLDKKGTVPDAQVAGQVTDVLEFATRDGFPAEGSKGKFYVDKGTGKAYEWSGTEYVESPDAPEFIRRMGVDLSRKADKVANATAGNLATLDENGNLVDSGNRVAGAFAADSFIGGGSGMAGFELDSTDKWVELYIDLHGGVILKFPLHGDTLAVQDDIAPTFDETDAYDEGALVFHNGLYRCVNANGHTGAWVAADFAESTVDDVLVALRTAVAGKQDALSAAQLTNIAAVPNKADASALRYAMTAAVALVAENDAATLVCADRAVTNATIVTGFSTLNLSFPAAVSGYVRDFYLRITVAAGESAPAISVPQGITIENAGGAVPEIADGEASAAATTLVWFSETAPGVFTAKSETVKAVV